MRYKDLPKEDRLKIFRLINGTKVYAKLDHKNTFTGKSAATFATQSAVGLLREAIHIYGEDVSKW